MVEFPWKCFRFNWSPLSLPVFRPQELQSAEILGKLTSNYDGRGFGKFRMQSDRLPDAWTLLVQRRQPTSARRRVWADRQQIPR